MFRYDRNSSFYFNKKHFVMRIVQISYNSDTKKADNLNCIRNISFNEQYTCMEVISSASRIKL